MLTKPELRASIIFDFEGEGRHPGAEIAPLPHMVGVFRPNERGKSGRYEWIGFKSSWKPASNGSLYPARCQDFEAFFASTLENLSEGRLIHWSQYEADILRVYLSQKLWKKIAPKLYNARLPAKRYTRKRNLFESVGGASGKSLEEFFAALYRKRHPYPPLKRGPAEICRRIDRVCKTHKKWKGFSDKQKSYLHDLIEYNQGDCRATWLIILKLVNRGLS